MSASLSAVFSPQFFTDAGVLAASFRLYTYAPGTTTHKSVYTDAAGSTPHTYTSDGAGGQYIALNARGELPAALYLTPGGYDLCLKTNAGATVWTRPARGVDDTVTTLSDLLDDYADGTTGFLVSMQRTAAEIAASVTPANYAFPPMDLRRYGADPTGANVCDSAIDDAIQVAQEGGGAIVFDAGTYKHADPIVIDWNHARVVFNGVVTLHHTGSGAYAVKIGVASNEISEVKFGKGGGPIIKAPSATAALWAQAANRSHIEFECAAAVTTALQVNFAVCSDFRVVCSTNIPTTTGIPVNGMKLDARGAGELVSTCSFEVIIEGVTGDGILNTAGQHCKLFGTSEGNGGRGYVESGLAEWNCVLLDCEANTGADYALGGYATKLDCALSNSGTAAAVVSGSRNVLSDTVFAKLTIDSTANHTVLNRASIYRNQLTDNGFETEYYGAYRNTAQGNSDIPDVTRKPKIKIVGPMAVFSATQENPCKVTISDNGLDYGDSILFAGVGGMTQLNGNTYQVEPITGTNSFYLLSAGSYVDATGFTAFTSGGTGTYCAFTNSWTNTGASFLATAGFWKSADGTVYLQGNVKSGAAGNSIFTLPAGFRPGGDVCFGNANMQPPEFATVSISSLGLVVPVFATAANCKISLDGMNFRAIL